MYHSKVFWNDTITVIDTVKVSPSVADHFRGNWKAAEVWNCGKTSGVEDDDCNVRVIECQCHCSDLRAIQNVHKN